jgi:hypothetical protein
MPKKSVMLINSAISCELGRGSTMSITEEIEKKFVDTLALLVFESKLFPSKSEYRNGWVDGYAEAWSQMTGQSSAGIVC